MKRSRLFTGFAVSAVLLPIVACSPDDDNGDDLSTITVGISPFQDTYIPLVGQEMGWFEEVGLEVELRSLSWNAVMPALSSGDIDASVFNTTGVVSVANTDPDVVYAYGWNPFTEGSALMIDPASELQSIDEIEAEVGDRDEARIQAVEQLEGRTVVTTLGTDMGNQLLNALESVEMNQNDVNIVDMDPDAGLAAFLSGTGEAYLGGVPQRGTALNNGMEVGLAGPDLAPPPINGLVTSNTYLQDNEDEILAFLNVIHRIIRYCDDETEACGEIITERMNQETADEFTVEDFVDFWQNVELYAPDAQTAQEMVLEDDGVAYWRDTWDSDNDTLVDDGAIPAPVDADEHFLMEEVWESYVNEYGERETGY